MALYIKNPQTEALARKVARLRNVGLTEAVHAALEKELERQPGAGSLIEKTIAFTRRLREEGDPANGLPADKEFIDSLYE